MKFCENVHCQESSSFVKIGQSKGKITVDTSFGMPAVVVFFTIFKTVTKVIIDFLVTMITRFDF